MQEFSQVFRIYCGVFFSFFLLHLFLELLHRFGCMMVLHGSPIFGVRFCDTGVGVARDDMAIKFWPWLFLALLLETNDKASSGETHAQLLIQKLY